MSVHSDYDLSLSELQEFLDIEHGTETTSWQANEFVNCFHDEEDAREYAVSSAPDANSVGKLAVGSFSADGMSTGDNDMDVGYLRG